MSELKLAVIGAGHLGKIHARLAKNLPQVKVVGVCDPAASARESIAQDLELPAFADYQPLLSNLDAAIVAAPTSLHAEVCRDLLKHGIHVLVEKPITPSAEQAWQLVEMAEQHNCVLQVGHVERFNPAMRQIAPEIEAVYYIEATRSTGFTFRSMDVGVVMDLMIHDLDLVLSLVKRPVADVRATGISIFGQHEDIAQARIEFDNGCVANLTASRASFVPQRTMRLFARDRFTSIDMTAGKAIQVQPAEPLRNRTFDVRSLNPEQQAAFRDELFSKWLPVEEVVAEPCNAIQEEQLDFVRSIRTGVAPQVSGVDGLQAVALAEQILEQLRQHRWGAPPQVAAGPLVNPDTLETTPTTIPYRKAG